MKEKLVEILENRRKEKSLSYRAWGKHTGVMYTSLYRFGKGQGELGIEAIRSLAQMAKEDGDDEIIIALAEYALDVEV